MSHVNVRKVHIDKKGNFKMCFSISNDSCPYRTTSFYEEYETIEDKVLAFIDDYNDDIFLTEGCTGNVADTLAYILEFSEIEKPLSVENFDISKFMECFENIREMSNIRYMIQVVDENGRIKSIVNFKRKAFTEVCNDDCLRNYWYAHRIKQRLRVPYKCTARIVSENFIDFGNER